MAEIGERCASCGEVVGGETCDGRHDERECPKCGGEMGVAHFEDESAWLCRSCGFIVS